MLLPQVPVAVRAKYLAVRCKYLHVYLLNHVSTLTLIGVNELSALHRVNNCKSGEKLLSSAGSFEVMNGQTCKAQVYMLGKQDKRHCERDPEIHNN